MKVHYWTETTINWCLHFMLAAAAFKSHYQTRNKKGIMIMIAIPFPGHELPCRYLQHLPTYPCLVGTYLVYLFSTPMHKNIFCANLMQCKYTDAAVHPIAMLTVPLMVHPFYTWEERREKRIQWERCKRSLRSAHTQ